MTLFRQTRANRKAQACTASTSKAAAYTTVALTSMVILAACGGSGGDTIVCTSEARASVVASPLDELSQPLLGVQVSYRINGGTQTTVNCDSSCSLIYEQAGRFDLTASKVGYANSSTSINVTRDVCHVKSESWQPMLRRL